MKLYKWGNIRSTENNKVPGYGDEDGNSHYKILKSNIYENIKYFEKLYNNWNEEFYLDE